MPQQINLFTPMMLAPKRQFTANRMARGLLLVLVLGGILSALWVHNLQGASAALQVTIDGQTREAESLRAAIAQSSARMLPVDEALQKRLQQSQGNVRQREAMVAVLQKGLVHAGQTYSDGLDWIARSIPAQAWVTDITLEPGRFALKGLTLDASALSAWVNALSGKPALANLQVATVQVEKRDAPTVANGPAVWSYTLASSAAPAPAPASAETPSAPRSRP